MAAPFTSKVPSLASVLAVIRQGRFTQATVLQEYQMCALEAIQSAYAMSVLYLDQLRYSQRQAVAEGLFFGVLYTCLTLSRPTKQTSKIRPVSSLFHRSAFASLVGQSLVHVTCMTSARALAVAVTAATDGGASAAAVGASGASSGDASGGVGRDFSALSVLSPTEAPTLLRNAVFLLGVVQSLCVVLVNYKGEPFMTGLSEIQGVLPAVAAALVGVGLLAFEVVPAFNQLLDLAPSPSWAYRLGLGLLMAVDVGGAYWVDRLATRVFNRELATEQRKGREGGQRKGLEGSGRSGRARGDSSKRSKTTTARRKSSTGSGGSSSSSSDSGRGARQTGEKRVSGDGKKKKEAKVEDGDESDLASGT